jgi:hypothetical protein
MLSAQLPSVLSASPAESRLKGPVTANSVRCPGGDNQLSVLAVKDGRVHEPMWMSEPEEHDYPAAATYLSLLEPPDQVDSLVASMRVVPVVHHKAKDVLRAAALRVLPRDNPHVMADLDKIAKKTRLSPVLMVRGDLARGRAAQIADGYHRVCASFYTDENAVIPCRLAFLDEQ